MWHDTQSRLMPWKFSFNLGSRYTASWKQTKMNLFIYLDMTAFNLTIQHCKTVIFYGLTLLEISKIVRGNINQWMLHLSNMFDISGEQALENWILIDYYFVKSFSWKLVKINLSFKTLWMLVVLCNYEVRFRPLVNFCKAVGDLFVEPSSRVLRVA